MSKFRHPTRQSGVFSKKSMTNISAIFTQGQAMTLDPHSRGTNPVDCQNPRFLADKGMVMTRPHKQGA